MLAGGATAPRDLKVPGRELKGIHFAMEYLTESNRRCEGDEVPALDDPRAITAKDKHVIIIGGGDTGADCLGTAHRQGARARSSARAAVAAAGRPRGNESLAAVAEHLPRLLRARRRRRAALLDLHQRFSGDAQGRVTTLHAVQVEIVNKDGRMSFEPVPGTEFELKADLVLLAMGFLGPERNGMLDQLGVQDDRPRQRVARRDVDDQRARACSPPATCSAASR